MHKAYYQAPLANIQVYKTKPTAVKEASTHCPSSRREPTRAV